ncbi:MAG TPA: hypothetical protein VNK41_06305 [Vicinamibacterales bacterium]|nr:hypothetical protein [Vicinamibacterales bacterium]
MRQGCGALAILILLAGTASMHADVPELAPDNAPSSGDVAPAAEPGPRLVIVGRVLDAAAGTPIPGASVYIYQTDRTGYYTTDGRNDNRNPRLRAHLRTDTAGGYEARTIRPAPYPRGGVPAHIHFVVQAPGYERRVFEIVFDDDPLVTEEIRRRAEQPASTFAIVSVPQTNATAHIRHDILLYR